LLAIYYQLSVISTICSFCLHRENNIGVIVDLHAAPGSQNPYDHSATRDGSQEWGTSDANIAQTVQVIEFLVSRFNMSNIYKFHPINLEPTDKN
jgi:aryl-phospho-beta-D-glucosidase BglC (GH1 family)